MRALVVTLLLLAGVVLTAEPVAACSCGSTTPGEAIGHAEAVFVGTVLERPDEETSSDPAAIWVFDVERVYKGEFAARQVVVAPSSSASCGLGFPDEGPVLVFATGHRSWLPKVDGVRWYSHQCSGSGGLDGAVPAFFGAGMAPAASEDVVDAGTTWAPIAVAGGIIVLLAAGALFALRRARH